MHSLRTTVSNTKKKKKEEEISRKQQYLMKYWKCIKKNIHRKSRFFSLLREFVWLFTPQRKHNSQSAWYGWAANILLLIHIYEQQHDKTNKIIYAPSKDSDQPGHPPRLIRVFTLCSTGSQGPKVPSCRERRLIRLGGCPGWSESSLGAQGILVGFVMLWFLCVKSHKSAIGKRKQCGPRSDRVHTVCLHEFLFEIK